MKQLITTFSLSLLLTLPVHAEEQANSTESNAANTRNATATVAEAPAADTGPVVVNKPNGIVKRYVTDNLWLQLRSGPGNEYRIRKTVRSGAHLIFKGESEDGKYSKVKTDKGLEGWVLSRFLVKEPIAKEKLILANRELDQVKAELNTTREQRDQLKAEIDALKSDRSGLSRNTSELQKELKRIKTISANAIALDEKTKKLTLRNQELEIKFEALTADNAQLRDDRQQTFLIYGGGLVIFGIIAGLILPSIRGKRSGGWS